MGKKIKRLSPALQVLLSEMTFTDPRSAFMLGVPMAQMEALLEAGLIREVTAPEVRQGAYDHRSLRKFVRVLLEADPNAIPPEHQFLGKTVEQWEADVVRRAAYFVVSKSNHDGTHDTKEFRSMVEAIENCGKGYCLSAVAPTGRFATLDRKNWDHYLEVYSARHKAAG